MEKHKAHYRLVDIQAIVSRDCLAAFTATALFNRLAMGLSDVSLLKAVADMKPTMFQKSMTTTAITPSGRMFITFHCLMVAWLMSS